MIFSRDYNEPFFQNLLITLEVKKLRLRRKTTPIRCYLEGLIMMSAFHTRKNVQILLDSSQKGRSFCIFGAL